MTWGAIPIKARAQGSVELLQVVSGHNEQGSLTLQTSAAPQVGDMLVVLHFNDHYTLEVLREPSPGGSTWIQLAFADNGTNSAHGKAWIREVTTSGVQSVDVRQGNNPDGGGGNDDACQFGWLAVVRGTIGADDAAGNNGGSTSQIAPAVTLAASSGLLLCGWATAGITTFTVPDGMDGEPQINCGTWSSSIMGQEQIDSAGSTGARTANANPSQGYAALSVVLGAS